MSVQRVLNWVSSPGWVVLSGGADPGGELRSTVLNRLKPEGFVAYLVLSEDEGDETLDDFEDLGAPTGYVVNLIMEDDSAIREQLLDASLIVIDNSAEPDEWRNALMGAAAEGILDALASGAVVLGEGSGATVLGEYVLNGSRIAEGLKLLQHALVLPNVTSVAQSPEAQQVLEMSPDAIAVGLGKGSALALGPDGSIETWGRRQVTIALGRNYQS
jgi:hypothetical protein